MNAGELDQRIQFQRKVATTDALNQEVLTWADYGDRVWASVKPLSGRSVNVADQIQESITLEVVVRKLAVQVSKFWRVIWQGRTLSVEVVLPLETRDGWRLLCSENTRDNTEGARGV